MPACVHVQHIMPGTPEGRRGLQDPLELELEAAVWPDVVLGTEPGSSERAANALNH